MDINGNNGGILHITHPGYPWFRFEFMGGKVHCIRVPRPGYGGAVTAEVIADEVHDVQAAKIAVGAFIIGYRMHSDEPVEFRGNGPRSYRLFCEGFGIGMRLGGALMVNRTIHLGKTPLAGGSVNAEADTWAAAVAGDGGTVSGARLTLVDTLISGLKTDGVWTKLDRLWLFAAENSQSALRDIRTAAAATAFGSPTFTANQGYTGTDASTTKYINSGFNPTTGSPQFTQNSAHIAAWLNTNSQSSASGGVSVGSGVGPPYSHNAIVPYYSDTQSSAFMNESFSASPAQANDGSSNAYFLGARNASGASSSFLYKGGGVMAIGSDTTSAPANLNFYMLARNSAGSPSDGDGRQISVVHWGAFLNGTEVTAIFGRLGTYRTNVGL